MPNNQFAFNIKYLYPFPNKAKKLHFPAQYVEIVIARNLNKHKLIKHEEMMASVTRHIKQET